MTTAAAIDRLLDARRSLAEIRDTTPAGTPLYLAVDGVIQSADGAIGEIRRTAIPRTCGALPS